MVVNIAHRGASAYFTENTMSAVEEAIYQKAQMIEVDVRFTNDGIPILFHDKTLLRLAGRRVRVKTFSFAELKVFPFTGNRSKGMKQLIRSGVDGMITNKPVLLRNALHNFPIQREL